MISFCIKYSKRFTVYHQKNEAVTDSSSIKTYVNKIENIIKFKFKVGCLIIEYVCVGKITRTQKEFVKILK